jgi:hypothetical protein
MRRLTMSWDTEGGRLVCRWIEEKCEPFSIADRLGFPTSQGISRRGRSLSRVVK